MTLQELNALLELAARAPKSQAETLWLQALVERQQQMLKAQPQPQNDTPEDRIAGQAT